MNTGSDLDRLITEWLHADASAAGAEPVLAAALSRVAGTGQERHVTQRVFGDRLGASPQLRWALLAAAIATAVLASALLAGALRVWPRPDDRIDGLGPLAFVRQGDLYLANPDGTGATLVAHVDGSPLSSPMWSPDGRWVAVQTPEPAILVLDTSTLELRRLAGGSITALASDLGPWRVGGWSPDGNELAFLTPRGGIAFVSVPEGAVRSLPGWPERSDPFPQPIAWSPDGRWIVTRSPTVEGRSAGSGGTEPFTLIRIDPMSGDVQPIVSPSEPWDYWLTWSPDSSRIAFSRNSRQLDGLWVATLDGSDSREIVPADSGPIWPMWSPDGAWIAFKSLDRSVRPDELMVVRPDGTDRRRLAVGVDRIVGWAADGSAIGYTADADDPETELHVLALEDGSDRILPVPVDGADFTWSSPVRDGEGAARPSTLPSAATSQPDLPFPEPPPGGAVGPDASWGGVAYRLQIGESDCAVAVLRFPDQVTVLPPPGAASSSPGEPASVPAAGSTAGPQPGPSCEVRFAPDGSSVMRALQPAWTFEVVRMDGTRLAEPIPFTDTPTWSPAGGWLAVSCQGDGCIGRDFIIRPDGSGTRELPGQPAWSADDRIIAVETPDGTLLVGNGDGTDLRAIGAFPLPAGWSRDGSGFVFVRQGNAWLAPADGVGERNMSQFDLGGVTGAWWSSDGRWIAVLQGSTMWVMSPDGAVRRRIGTALGPGEGRWGPPWAPVWSPDGAWLAIEHGDEIALVRMADWYTVRLANAWQPAWSSDGRHLAVVSEDGNGAYRVDVMNADGTGRLTVATGVNPPVTWVP